MSSSLDQYCSLLEAKMGWRLEIGLKRKYSCISPWNWITLTFVTSEMVLLCIKTSSQFDHRGVSISCSPPQEWYPDDESQGLTLSGCVLHHISIWWLQFLRVAKPVPLWWPCQAVAALAMRRAPGSWWPPGFDPFGGGVIEYQCFQTAVTHSACVYSDMLITARVRSQTTNLEEKEELANLLGFRNFIELIDFCYKWVNDVLWKLLRTFMWLQEKWNCSCYHCCLFYRKILQTFY